MSISNRAAISRLLKIVKEINADSRFTKKLAHSVLLSTAKLLIKRDSDRLKLMSQSSVFKKLKCVKVIEAPAIDPCCGIRSNCTVWRTEKKLPDLYLDTDGPIIREVYTIDGKKKLQKINVSDYESLSKNPWNKSKKDIYFFYSEGYLYFPNGAYKMVEVDGYWEGDLTGFSECNDDSEDGCKPFLDQNFNIPGYYERDLFTMAEQEVLGTYLNIPEKVNEINKNDKPQTTT